MKFIRPIRYTLYSLTACESFQIITAPRLAPNRSKNLNYRRVTFPAKSLLRESVTRSNRGRMVLVTSRRYSLNFDVLKYNSHNVLYETEFLASRAAASIRRKSYVNEIVATVTVTFALHCEVYAFYRHIKDAYCE